MRTFMFVAAGVLAGSALGAQTPRVAVDARVLPFVGCWQNASDDLLARLPTPSRTLCVVPGESATSLRLLSVRGDSIVADEALDIGGRRVPVTRESCRGFSTSRVAQGGVRVFIEETLECSGGISARSTEVLDLAGPLEFVQVRAWRRQETGDARFARWTALDDSATSLPAEVRQALGSRARGIATAREMANTDVTFEGIIEASAQLDEPVVRAWVYARGAGNRVRVTGAQLRSLKQQGVPGSVTDVLVALSNPDVFRFANQAMVAMQAREPNARGSNAWGPWAGGMGMPGAFALGSNPCFTGWGLCMWDPFMWNGFGNPWLGFNRFGWGGGGGWGGWGGWGGGLPIGWIPGSGTGGGVVPVYTGPRESGGYVDRRRGYTSGGNAGADGGAAAPRGGPPAPTTRASGGGSSGGSGSSSGMSGASSSGGGGGGRVAVPKPPR